VGRWQQRVAVPVPGVKDAPAWVNPSGGNLVLRLAHPEGGPFDPRPVLTYNSQSPATSEFGYGWSGAAKETLTSTSAGVDITDGLGTLLHYTDQDASNRYRVPGSTSDSLVQNADGTWTQTQPDGFQTVFNTSGYPTRLVSAAGDRWTISYDSGNPVLWVGDPFNRRTTYSYTAGGNIRRVQDPAARITSFVLVHCSGGRFISARSGSDGDPRWIVRA
jgi:YD repeat-containing protein